MGPPGGEVIYCSLTNILLHAEYCFPDRTPRSNDGDRQGDGSG